MTNTLPQDAIRAIFGLLSSKERALICRVCKHLAAEAIAVSKQLAVIPLVLLFFYARYAANS